MEVMETALQKAYNLFLDKDFSTALNVLEEAKSKAGKEVELFKYNNNGKESASYNNFKGFIFLGSGNNEEAKTSFEKALQENPNSSQACAGLGEVFYLQGRDEEAKMMYEWALELNIENEFARGGLSKVNKTLGLPGFHNSFLMDSMNEKDQVDFNKFLTDAYVLFREKKFNQSLQLIVDAQDILNKENLSNSTIIKVSALENFKGFNYLAMNDLEAAEICFQKALNLDPRSSQACAGIGELFYLQNMDEEAKTMYEWSVYNDERNDFGITGLAKVNTILGYPENHSSLNN